MSLKKRISEYLKNNFSEVVHTTLNPEGPGVVMLPEKKARKNVLTVEEALSKVKKP